MDSGATSEKPTISADSALGPLADTMEVRTLAAALSVDEDSVYRWLRGGNIDRKTERAMRLLLALRHCAPGIVSRLGLPLADLLAELGDLTAVYLTADDITRRRNMAAMKRAPRGAYDGAGL